ncbi:hypothetical protein [Flavobacterium sp.]|uniref:hypothetical protein n=1 Tax=Flavobacterium sp. TaxID=239 RepID=UPI0039E62BA6
MKTLLFCLLCIPTGWGQTHPGKLKTAIYAGIYTFGNDTEAPNGSIIIYPETDTSVLFYIDLANGAPAYHVGALYGRAEVEKGKGEFFQKSDGAENNCRWKMAFDKDKLTIETVEGQYDCGFGQAVYADEIYLRKKQQIIEYFNSGKSRKVYFAKTSPESYKQ